MRAVEQSGLRTLSMLLSEKPAGYSTDVTDADADGEWTFSSGRITHQRADNSRFEWAYEPGTQGGGDDAKIGTWVNRTAISNRTTTRLVLIFIHS